MRSFVYSTMPSVETTNNMVKYPPQETSTQLTKSYPRTHAHYMCERETPHTKRFSTSSYGSRSYTHTGKEDATPTNDNGSLNIVVPHNSHMTRVSSGPRLQSTNENWSFGDLTETHYYPDTLAGGSFDGAEEVPSRPVQIGDREGDLRFNKITNKNNIINNDDINDHSSSSLHNTYRSLTSSRMNNAKNIWQMLSVRTTNFISLCLFIYWSLYLGYGITTSVMLLRFTDLMEKCNSHVQLFLQGFTILSWISWIIVGLWAYVFMNLEMPKLVRGLPMSQLTITLSTLLGFTLMVGMALSFYGLFAARTEDVAESVVCGKPYTVARAVSITHLVLTATGLISYMVFYSIMTRRMYDSWNTPKVFSTTLCPSKRDTAGGITDRPQTGRHQARSANTSSLSLGDK
eukprot:Tbor_TRINITY_DN8252_c0_g1::TRINITY_DN8252_c0_g1_i1::g.15389::m.15389